MRAIASILATAAAPAIAPASASPAVAHLRLVPGLKSISGTRRHVARHSADAHASHAYRGTPWQSAVTPTMTPAVNAGSTSPAIRPLPYRRQRGDLLELRRADARHLKKLLDRLKRAI